MNRILICALCVVGAGSVVISSSGGGTSSGQSGGLVRLQPVTPGVEQQGNLNISGTAIIGRVESAGSAVFWSEPGGLDGPIAAAMQANNFLNTNNYAAVFGNDTAATAQTYAVYGETQSTSGTAVIGDALASSGTTYAIVGRVASSAGYSGHFTGGKGVLSTAFTAVTGQSNAANGNGVVGIANGGSNAWGVHGQTSSGQGVVGQAGTISGGGFPALTGVVARSTSLAGFGLWATNTNATGIAAHIAGKLQIVDGTQAANSFLSGNASGTASWTPISSLNMSNWTRVGNDLYPNTPATTNVGIGTTTPASRFHVNNTALVSGASAARITYGSGGGNQTAIGLNIVSTPFTTNAGIQRGISATSDVDLPGVNTGSAFGSVAVSSAQTFGMNQFGVQGIATAGLVTNNPGTTTVMGTTGTADLTGLSMSTLPSGGQDCFFAGAAGTIIGAPTLNIPVNDGAYAGVVGRDLTNGTAVTWAGFFEGDVYASGVFTSSDERFKTRVTTLGQPLDIVSKLRGVTFDWSTDAPEFLKRQKGTQVGFIAQELQAVLPSLVKGNEDSGYTVNYPGLAPVLVEAVKATNSKIQKLEGENEALRRELQELKAIVEGLRSTNRSPNSAN